MHTIGKTKSHIMTFFFFFYISSHISILRGQCQSLPYGCTHVLCSLPVADQSPRSWSPNIISEQTIHVCSITQLLICKSLMKRLSLCFPRMNTSLFLHKIRQKSKTFKTRQTSCLFLKLNSTLSAHLMTLKNCRLLHINKY